MKKTKVTILILFLFTLTSCFKPIWQHVAYFYAIDDYWNVRYVLENKSSKFYSVDEYYYNGDTDSDNIIINIEIPKEINGVSVAHLAGGAYAIEKEVYKFHDNGYRQGLFCMDFAIITNNTINKNSYVEINIYLSENIETIRTDGAIIIYNNSEYYDEFSIFYNNYSVNFYIDENNSLYYSKDGIVYCKEDDSIHNPTMVYSLKMKGNKLREPYSWSSLEWPFDNF